MDTLTLLATDPTHLVELAPRNAFGWSTRTDGLQLDPPDPSTRVHMTNVGEIVTVVPTMTIDKDLQAEFENSVRQRQINAPESLDSVEELVPGIFVVHQEDGISMRGTMDIFIGYNFAVAAKQIGLDPSTGKATFTRLLNHIGNQQLQYMARQVSPKELENRAHFLSVAQYHIGQRSGSDMLYDMEGRRFRYQVAIDYDLVRSAALSLARGDVKIDGVGAGGIAILRYLFDIPAANRKRTKIEH